MIKIYDKIYDKKYDKKYDKNITNLNNNTKIEVS
jgi:hypothetical protein